MSANFFLTFYFLGIKMANRKIKEFIETNKSAEWRFYLWQTNTEVYQLTAKTFSLL